MGIMQQDARLLHQRRQEASSQEDVLFQRWMLGTHHLRYLHEVCFALYAQSYGAMLMRCVRIPFQGRHVLLHADTAHGHVLKQLCHLCRGAIGCS